MNHALARAGYSLLLRLLTPAYLARLWWRGAREPLYRSALHERLGYFRGTAEPGRLWVHAVSLGEARAAAPLIDALRRSRPGLKLLLTHGTATGREAGRALLLAGDAQSWLPYDTPGAVRRFLRRHRPAVGVLMETEVWPNLLIAARESGVPMVLANARLSEKSLSKGRRVQALLRPTLDALTATLAQTEADARRLRLSGVTAVQVTGNLKFDMTPNPGLLARGQAWREALGRPVVLAAASREGEEADLLAAWATLQGPRPLLLLVPRHPQRFDEVATLAAGAFPTVLRRSAWAEVPPPSAALADVWVGDSIGEMPLYYGMADAALLGGSFAPLGGQNLIEAAACGCPLVMGPHTFNFAAAAELSIAAGAAERASDIDDGVRRAVLLTTDPQRPQRVQAALRFAAEHRGAAERIAEQVGALLDLARR